jgi:hypothetical protein
LEPSAPSRYDVTYVLLLRRNEFILAQVLNTKAQLDDAPAAAVSRPPGATSQRRTAERLK